MCFSAGASFAAAGFLALIGFLSIKEAPKHLKFFAAIPLLFAIQQCTEGILWLLITGLPEPSAATKSPFVIPILILGAPIKAIAKTFSLQKYYELARSTATFVFLTFALVIWPSWVPFSVAYAEENKPRKNMIFMLCVFGSFLSVVLLHILLQGVKASNGAGHIVYTIPHFLPLLSWEELVLYSFATVLPLFISSIQGTKFLAVSIVSTAAFTWYIWYAAFTSIWCFFAAVVSVGIFSIVHKQNTIHKNS